MNGLLALVFALAFAHDDGVVPVASLAPAQAELGRVMDVEGDWMATLEVLPIPESERMYHAPRPPWKLRRVRRNGLAPVTVTESGATRSGWGAPQYGAIGADGAIAITWRPGRHLALFSPAGTKTDHWLELPYGLNCAHLEVDGVIHGQEVGEKQVQLSWRMFDANGVGEPIDLGVASIESWALSTQFVRDGDRLYWVRGAGELASFDVTGREVEIIPCAGIEHFVLDSIRGGVLFAHSNEGKQDLSGAMALARLVDLSTGRALDQAVGSRIALFTQYGLLTSESWIDPVEGTCGTLERAINVYDPMVQIGEREFWTNGRYKRLRVQLRLDGAATPAADNAKTMAAIEEMLKEPAAEHPLPMRSVLQTLTRPYADAAMTLLDRVARDWPDPNDRRLALRMIGSSRHPRAMGLLVRHLVDEPNWWDRMTAVGALADHGDPECVPAILAAIPVDKLEGDYATRVASALEVLGNECALEYLETLFERGRDPHVGAALRRLGERRAFLKRLR